MEWLKGIADVLKLGPRYLVAGALLTGIALFAPPSWHQALGVWAWTSAYRGWIGLAFAVCVALLLVACLHWVWRFAVLTYDNLATKREIRARLNNLTEPEKAILRYYVVKRTRSNSLRHQDGVVAGLSTAGIIYLASQTGHHFDGFAFNIGEYAWSVLQEKPELLLGETTDMRCDRAAKPWDEH